MRLSIIWRTDQGAFHVGKSSGSTRFECKWNAWFDRKFFGTNGRPSELFHFFRSNRLEQKFRFHLRNSLSAEGWHLDFFSAFFNVCRWALITGCRSFSFHFLSYRSKWHLFKIVVSSVRVQISWKETATNWRYFHYWQESLSIWPGRFPEFPIGNFP